VRFVMGNNAKLKYGARLIHSYLGDNSTVSCCEILNNLVFPAHEQHHNNSFLTAALILGQSNIAAGATLGSNHNSRANDGEILAGRGFWPGLCVTLKHSCRFASFVLLSKADYPAELDIPFPFALVSNDAARDELRVAPAWWWLHNMYALARNTWKFQSRDQRVTKTQHIEFDSLAPDTAEECFRALELLERAVGRAAVGGPDAAAPPADDVLRAAGRELLMDEADRLAGLKVYGEGLENSRRKTLLLKPWAAYRAYRDMLHCYAMNTLLLYLQDRPQVTAAEMFRTLRGPREQAWENLGGQLAPQSDVDALREEIRSGRLDDWEAVHRVYDRLWDDYPLARTRHALATLCDLHQIDQGTTEFWDHALDEAVRIQRFVCQEVYRSRKKDYDNRFRQITFRNAAEMRAVVGTAEGNSFVRQVRAETEKFVALVEEIRRRG